jgi:hypothetical protein
MTQLIKIKSGDTEFWIEPEEDVNTGQKLVNASILEDLSEKGIDFNKFSKLINNICVSLKGSLDDLPKDMRPSKISTEFGLKISGEGGIFVVKTSAEASLTITAEWQFS